MRLPDRSGGLLLAAALLALAACSEEAGSGPPTEQEIHAAESGTLTGRPIRHPYRCDDGRPLFVDFRDSGLQVELRDAVNGPPMLLTAPTQGLQYVGERATATLSGPSMTIVMTTGRTRICRREGSR